MKELRISLDEKDFEVLVGGGIVGVPSALFARFGVQGAPDVKIALQDIGTDVIQRIVMVDGKSFLPSQVVWKETR